MAWPLAEAKNKLSEVVRRALEDGPQRITRRGDSVVVLAEDEYRRLTGARPGLAAWLTDGPDLEGVDLARDPSPMRPVDLGD